MARDYDPAVGITQTAAQVASRLHAGQGDLDAWQGTFESVLSILIEETSNSSGNKSAGNSQTPLPPTGNSSPVTPPPPAPNSVQGKKPAKQEILNFMAQNPSLVFDNRGNPRFQEAKQSGKPWAAFKIMDKAGAPMMKMSIWEDCGLTSFIASDGETYEYGSTDEALNALGQMIEAA